MNKEVFEALKNIPKGHIRLEYNPKEGFYEACELTKSNDLNNGYHWLGIMPEIEVDIFICTFDKLYGPLKKNEMPSVQDVRILLDIFMTIRTTQMEFSEDEE